MKIHYFTPYAIDRNLGRAYNECLDMIPSGDWACLRDGDTMFLSPDFGHIIHNYAEQNPGCVMTCFTNRIHQFSKDQIYGSASSDQLRIDNHIATANNVRAGLYNTTPCTGGSLSGFLMLIPKTVWNKVKFTESLALLGVDTQFYKDLRAAGVPILRMDGLYIFHTYRLGKDIKDTTHLK